MTDQEKKDGFKNVRFPNGKIAPMSPEVWKDTAFMGKNGWQIVENPGEFKTVPVMVNAPKIDEPETEQTDIVNYEPEVIAEPEVKVKQKPGRKAKL